jgi:hypothetical protein
MTPDHLAQEPATEIDGLVAELDVAEVYEQRLRQLITDGRDQLAAGSHEKALSMLNGALNEIDSATDVVVPDGRRDAPQ